MTHTLLRAYRQRGVTLLETALALAVLSAALVGLLQLSTDQAQRVRAASVGERMNQVTAAAQTYIATHGSSLAANIPAGGSAAVSVAKTSAGGAIPAGPYAGIPSVQGGGFLPSNFIDVNAYGQSTVLLIKHIAAVGSVPDHLEGLLTTSGGNPMPDSALTAAMTKLGATGGGVMATPPPGVAANTVQGNYGGWSTTVGSWTVGGNSPSVGHLASNLVLTGGTATGSLSPYLNRYNTGNPEANRMHASVDMNNNDITGVNTATITTANTTTENAQTLNVSGVSTLHGNVVGCADNVTGCRWQISDDGAFVDNNDGWITFVGVYNGLKLAGAGNNLSVGGKTVVSGGTGSSAVDAGCGGGCGLTVYNGIALNGDWLRIHGSNGVYWQDWGGGLYMQDATWIRTFNNASLYTGNGSIKTENNVYAANYVDKNNYGYYLTPSSTSVLHQLWTDGWISTQTNITAGGNINAMGDVVAGNLVSAPGGVFTNVLARNGWIQADYPGGCPNNADGTPGACGDVIAQKYLVGLGGANVGQLCTYPGSFARGPYDNILHCKCDDPANCVFGSPGLVAHWHDSIETEKRFAVTGGWWGWGAGSRSWATAWCINGAERAVGGGGYCDSGADTAAMYQNEPNGTVGWNIGCSSTTPGDWNNGAVAYVVCMPSTQ